MEFERVYVGGWLWWLLCVVFLTMRTARVRQHLGITDSAQEWEQLRTRPPTTGGGMCGGGEFAHMNHTKRLRFCVYLLRFVSGCNVGERPRCFKLQVEILGTRLVCVSECVCLGL